MDLTNVVKDVAETIQREASTRTVFGEPMKLDEHTIVPVALVHIAVGAGGGGTNFALRPDKPGPSLVGAGGGGIDVTTVPIGFISERDGVVTFTAIPRPELPGVAPAAVDKPLADRIRAAFAKH